jgi:HD superfamily phosphohydrolase
MRILRLTGLLHDIGHGPFSHVSEDIVSRVLKQDKFDNVSIALDAIILNEPMRSCLGKDTDAVLDLLGNKERTSIDHDIIDSDLDADKLDYLLRDSYYSGVPYGHPDTLRILYTLKEIPAHEGGEFSLGISMKGIEAAEGLKIARYHMHSAVYNHKVRRIADSMLVRATVRAIQDGKLDSSHFAYRKGDRDFLKAYFALNDRELMERVIAGGGPSGRLMDDLRHRRLLKRGFVREMSEFVGPTRDRIIRLGRDRISRLEDEIATDSEADPFRVVVDLQSIDNPTYRAPAGTVSVKNILVDAKPFPKYLYEMAGPWSSDIKAIQKLWVFCDGNRKERVEEIATRVFEGF